MRASILCHYAGQPASVALCMYQALQKAESSLASLCSGPETGLAGWVRIKKQQGKLILFFTGALSVSWRVCHPGYQVSVALQILIFWGGQGLNGVFQTEMCFNLCLKSL